MSSKKKPRPLFEVPVEIGSARESGWVYRSEHDPVEPLRHADIETDVESDAETSIVEMSAHAMALAMATISTTFLVSMRVTALPLRVGLRALDSIAGQNPR